MSRHSFLIPKNNKIDSDLQSPLENFTQSTKPTEACKSLQGPSEPNTTTKLSKPTRLWIQEQQKKSSQPEGIYSFRITKGHMNLTHPTARIWTTAELLGSTASVLIDSGNTSLSAIPTSIFNIINSKRQHKLQLKPYTNQVLAAGGQKLNIKGYITEPLELFIKGLKQPLTINALVLDSNTTHINLGVKDLELNNITITFNNNETILHQGLECINLYDKTTLQKRLQSPHKLLLLEALNEIMITPEKELTEADIIASISATSQLTKLLSPTQILLQSRHNYSIQESLQDAYLHSTSTQENISECSEEMNSLIEDTLNKITNKNTSTNQFTAKAYKPTKIPANSHVFVKVKSQMPYGTTYSAEPTAFFLQSDSSNEASNHLTMAYNIGRVSDPDLFIYLPVYNWNNINVTLMPNSQLATITKVKIQDEPVKQTEKVLETSTDMKTQNKRCEDIINEIGNNSQANLRFSTGIAEQDFLDEENRIKRNLHDPSCIDTILKQQSKTSQGKILANLTAAPKTEGFLHHGHILTSQQMEDNKQANNVKPANLKTLDDLTPTELQSYFATQFKLDTNKELSKHPAIKNELLETLKQYKSCFNPGNTEGMAESHSKCNWVTYDIQLKEESTNKVFQTPVRRMTPEDRDIFAEILKTWMQQGIIRHNDPSSPHRSPHSHAIILVKKQAIGAPPGSPARLKRFVLDLRDLNKHSVSHTYHLKSVTSSLQSLQKGCLFAKFDYSNAFSSIPISPRSSDLVSFSTEDFGSFSFLRVPQGLHVAPAVFIALVSRILNNIPPNCRSFFLDDVL